MKKIEYKNLGEVIYKTKLKNGLKVYLLPEADVKTTYVDLLVNYGSIHTSYIYEGKRYDHPFGIAHFFEHKIFAMPDGTDAFQTFSNLGAESNAMTSKTVTRYIFQTTQDLIKPLEYLFQMLDTPHYTDENVYNERLIINEELKMYLDDPYERLNNLLLENVYQTDAIKADIGGTIESIEKITKEHLYEVYNAFYHNDNRILVIGGYINIDKVDKFLKAYDAKTSPRKSKPKLIPFKEKQSVNVKKVVLKEEVVNNQILIAYKQKAKTIKNQVEKFKTNIIMRILLEIIFGKSSDFYESMVDEKLVNSNYSVDQVKHDNQWHIQFYAESNKPNLFIKKLNEFISTNLLEKLTKEAFEIELRSYFGQFINSLIKFQNKTTTFAVMIALGISLYDYFDIIKSIQYEEVLEALKTISFKNKSVVIFKKS